MNDHAPGLRQPVYSGKVRVRNLYVRTRADGTTVYEVAQKISGRTRRHTLTATTKTDAIREMHERNVDLSRGDPRVLHGGLTVAEFAPDWIAHLQARVNHRDPRQRRSARTVDLNRQRVDQWIVPVLGQRPVADLVLTDVRRLVDRLNSANLAPSTASGVISIFSGLCRYAVKSGLLERNPVRDLDRDDRPGVARLTEPRYLTAAELDSLLSKMTDSFRPVAATCTYAALRISEALGLRWADVDFKAGELMVTAQLGPSGERVPTKSIASTATVPLLPALARELQAHRSRQASIDLRRVHADALVFTTKRARPQSRRNALRAVHAAGDAAGLNPKGREKVGLHDLRHSYVALALASGASVAEAAALARHANAKVTAAVYAGLSDGGRQVAAQKLLEAGFGR